VEHPIKTQSLPIGVVFHRETLRRIGRSGDNFCLTWAADDSQITSMDDGNWLDEPHSYSNHLYRLIGGANDFQREDVPGYPQFLYGERGWFGYGLCSVGGALYSFVSKCPLNSWSGPFRGMKLLKSYDNGASWVRVNRRGEERPLGPWDPVRNEVSAEEMFFLEEAGRIGHGGMAYPFASCDAVQEGRDHGASRDGYVYLYSPEGACTAQLLLARAPAEALSRRDAWEFYCGWQGGQPLWNHDLQARQPVHAFPARDDNGDVFGWYSWLPSVVWNQGLGLYLMVNGGTYGGHGLSGTAEDYYHRWMHTRSGSLGFWWSRHPWGPWTPFYYAAEWTVDSPDNRTYQPKLSPKWISADGRHLVLIWSDAMKNAEGKSHTVNYRWNQMEISLLMPDESQ